MAAQQRRHVLVQHEAAPQHPAMPKHQREQPDDAHDAGLIGKLGLELGEVDLRLLPRRRLEAQLEGGGTAGRISRSRSVTAV